MTGAAPRLWRRLGYTSVGVISAGGYSFSTEKDEEVTIIEGALDVRLPGEGWRRVTEGGSYQVPAGVTFEVRAEADVAYVCKFG